MGVFSPPPLDTPPGPATTPRSPGRGGGGEGGCGRGRRTAREDAAVEILAAAAETLRVPAPVDLAAFVIGALTGGLLAAREGFAVSGVLLLAVSGGGGGGGVP